MEFPNITYMLISYKITTDVPYMNHCYYKNSKKNNNFLEISENFLLYFKLLLKTFSFCKFLHLSLLSD